MANDYIRFPGDNIDVDIYCYDKNDEPLAVNTLDQVNVAVYNNGRLVESLVLGDPEITLEDNVVTVELTRELSLTLKRGLVQFLVTLVAPEASFVGNLHYQSKLFKVADMQPTP